MGLKGLLKGEWSDNLVLYFAGAVIGVLAFIMVGDTVLSGAAYRRAVDVVMIAMIAYLGLFVRALLKRNRAEARRVSAARPQPESPAESAARLSEGVLRLAVVLVVLGVLVWVGWGNLAGLFGAAVVGAFLVMRDLIRYRRARQAAAASSGRHRS